MHAHLVFVTKHWRNVFHDKMLRRCEEIMVEVCDSFEAELVEFNGEDDHVTPASNNSADQHDRSNSAPRALDCLTYRRAIP